MKNILRKIIIEKNPFAKIRRTRMRRRLENKNPTLLCPNCLGGILFHDLGIKFYSPTVNLMMTQKDFVQFVLNLDEFLEGEFHFFEHEKEKCPCAWLESKKGKSIVVHFTHYHSQEEALEKWKLRIKRVNHNNMFVCMMERDSLTKEEILELGKLQLRGLVVFTANKYDDIPYALHVPFYERAGEVGNLLKRNYLDDSRKYENYFDFVKWFNEANGKNYDISKFKK